MFGIFGILIALVTLIYFAYRGVSVLILAPVTALLAALLSGDTPLLGAYTQTFMRATGNFIAQYFPVFLLGAIFGKLMDDSGSAQATAEWIIKRLGRENAILSVVLSCAILTYGGVSLFVVAFAVFPIADALFRQADLPKRLIPATIALGAFTFTMTALPGTPSIQNAIPMPFYGTTAFAAPGLGLITGAIMLLGGQMWLSRQAARARALREGYGAKEDRGDSPVKAVREYALGEGFDISETPLPAHPGQPPHFLVAVTPVILVIVLNFVFLEVVIPALDASYLQQEKYGSTTIEALRGIWAIICALVASILVLIALNWHRLSDCKQSLGDGANASVLPIFNTASQVGFGAVIASLGTFVLVRDAILSVGRTEPLISLALSVNVLAGITGSASGGMSIALQTLGSEYVALARDAGISLELMHRVTTVATGGLDTLPHNGAVITLLAICGLTHREAYFDIFIVAVVIPLVALAVLVALGSLIGTF
ncbi:GntP family permease [Microvirga guangxiensis]|uniref:H+/gluconate symporter n=1 Tax=Microvirga guangxiensis TaxID=549386 RepID=A0A1G5K9P6_9HYPH|nr:GntP family permease [Microvirga guangxiensis]SCY97352.1 H+/gluconate symporter [Microvirga guangxiensis]